MRTITCLACGLLLVLLPSHSRADAVLLGDGSELSGTIAGREPVLPGAVCDAPVLIVSALDPSREVAADSEARKPFHFRPPSKTKGIVLMGSGAAIGLTGVLVPFGNDRYSGGSPPYNVANIGMWIIGGTLLTWGVITYATASAAELYSGPALEPSLSPISMSPGVAITLPF